MCQSRMGEDDVFCRFWWLGGVPYARGYCLHFASVLDGDQTTNHLKAFSCPLLGDKVWLCKMTFRPVSYARGFPTTTSTDVSSQDARSLTILFSCPLFKCKGGALLWRVHVSPVPYCVGACLSAVGGLMSHVLGLGCHPCGLVIK